MSKNGEMRRKEKNGDGMLNVFRNFISSVMICSSSLFLFHVSFCLSYASHILNLRRLLLFRLF